MTLCALCWYAMECSKSVLDGAPMPRGISAYFDQQSGKGKGTRMRKRRAKVDRSIRERRLRISRCFIRGEE